MFRLLCILAIVFWCDASGDGGIALLLSTGLNSDDSTITFYGDESSNATGLHQSPINIQLSDTTKELYTHGLQFIGYDQPFKGATLRNNGETVMLEIPKDAIITFTGPHLKLVKYQLKQLHFHWDETDGQGAEHTINGEKFPLELHLVHYSSDNQIAVISVIFQLVKKNQAGNVMLSKLTQFFGNITVGPAQETIQDSMTILPLLPSDQKSFLHYNGSLTTPPFTENVQWTVFPQLQDVTAEQLAIFRTLSNNGTEPTGHHRQVQPLNNRTIYFYASSASKLRVGSGFSAIAFTILIKLLQ